MAEGRENDFQIYNSMTKQKEKFNPITPGKVAMYVCGVISYDFSHIGHARAYVAFDFLFRYLKYLGYEVKYVRNFTDVDDKHLRWYLYYYSGGGGPLLQNQFQGQNSHLSSMALLSEVSRNHSFDMNGFSQLSGYLTTVGTSQRQLGGLALSQNVCFMQQNQEFSNQNEHSPASHGYKGTSDQKGAS